MLRLFLILFVGLSLLFCIANSQGTEPDPTDDPNSGAIPVEDADGVTDAVRPSPRPTLYGYLKSTTQHEIMATLTSTSQFKFLRDAGSRQTLFAPRDQAFKDFAFKLSNNTVNRDNITVVVSAIRSIIPLLVEGEGYTDLNGILHYHVLDEDYYFQQLQELGQIKTLQGKNITFRSDQRVVIDLDSSRGETSSGPSNVFCQNGWLHVIDSILLPFNLEDAVRSLSRPDGMEGTNAPNAPSTTPPSTSGPVTVPAPEPSPESDAVCFPGSARVHMADGDVIAMDALEGGMRVMHDERRSSSQVFLFTHRRPDVSSWFYKLSTASGHAVSMSGNHYLYANDVMTSADAVKVGDVLRTVAGNSAVVSVDMVLGKGLYAPHSMNGDLVVDGIVVSGYTRTVHPRLAHVLLMPVRWISRVTGIKEPLGKLLYSGGGGMEMMLPSGSKQHFGA